MATPRRTNINGHNGIESFPSEAAYRATLDWEEILREHERLKKSRGRGSYTQGQLSAVEYLKKLEREMQDVRKHLDEAWAFIDDSRQFRRASRHMDHAQQRLHRVIKKVAKRK